MRKRSFQLHAEFLKGNKSKLSIGWNASNQLKVWTKDSSMVLSQVERGNGEFIEDENESPPLSSTAASFEFIDMRIRDDNRLEIYALQNPLDGERAIKIQLDLSQNEIEQTKSFSSLEAPEAPRQTMFARDKKVTPTMVSPDGNFILTWAEKTSKNGRSEKNKNLLVTNLNKPNQPLSIMDAASASQALWSSDGKRLVVSKSRWPSRSGHLKIVDLENWRILSVKSLAKLRLQLVNEWNNGFVFRDFSRTLRHKNLSQIGFLSNTRDAEYQSIDKQFESIDFLDFSDSSVLIRGKLADENQTSAAPKFFKLSLKSSKLDLEEVSAPAKSFPANRQTEYRSHDGKYRIEYQTKKEESGLTSGRYVIIQSAQRAETNTDTEIYVCPYNVLDEFRWHPKTNAAIWRENRRNWLIFNPETQSEPKRVYGIKFTAPIRNGWLVATSQNVRQVDFEGNTIAELSFDQNESGEITNPVWIFADGTVIGNNDSVQIIYETKDEIRTESLSQFLKQLPGNSLPPTTRKKLDFQPVTK
jgi:hypothetical protein